MTQTYAPNPTTLLGHWMRRGYSPDILALMTTRRPNITFTELALWADTQLPIGVLLEHSHLHPLHRAVRVAIWNHSGWDEDCDELDAWLDWMSRYDGTPVMSDPQRERGRAQEALMWFDAVDSTEDAELYLRRGFTPDQARRYQVAGRRHTLSPPHRDPEERTAHLLRWPHRPPPTA